VYVGSTINLPELIHLSICCLEKVVVLMLLVACVLFGRNITTAKQIRGGNIRSQIVVVAFRLLELVP